MKRTSPDGLDPSGELYLRWRGKVTGPFNASAVKRMLLDGRVSKHHEVSEDQRTWLPVSRRPELPVRVSRGERASGGMEDPTGDRGSSRLSGMIEQRRVPESAWGSSGAYAFGSATWAVLAFGLGPLVFLFLSLYCRVRFAQIAWLFSTYFCCLWAWMLGNLRHCRGEVWRFGILFAVFTAFAGVVMLLVWRQIPFFAVLYAGAEAESLTWRLAGLVLGVGVCEELCKAAPIILFGLRTKMIRRASDALLLGMFSGLGFAISEGVEYTVEYWTRAAGLGAAMVQRCAEQATSLYGAINREEFAARLLHDLPVLFEEHGRVVIAQLVRFMALPVLHACWAGLVGFALGKAFITGRYHTLAAGFGAAALLHGLYNLLSPGILGLLVAGVSITITMVLLQQDDRSSGRLAYE